MADRCANGTCMNVRPADSLLLCVECRDYRRDADRCWELEEHDVVGDPDLSSFATIVEDTRGANEGERVDDVVMVYRDLGVVVVVDLANGKRVLARATHLNVDLDALDAARMERARDDTMGV